MIQSAKRQAGSRSSLIISQRPSIDRQTELVEAKQTSDPDTIRLLSHPYIMYNRATTMDQYRSPLPDHQETVGSDSQSENMIQGKGVSEAEQWSTGHVDIIALVRSLQRTAGMTDCFRMGNEDCDVVECDWRHYCLGKPVSSAKK